MAEFTRGPWAVVKRYPVPEFKIVAGDPGELGPIQQIGCFENEADAHLAAAALQMYEAMKAFPLRNDLAEQAHEYLKRIAIWYTDCVMPALSRAENNS
jgi:hypothetical protein